MRARASTVQWTAGAGELVRLCARPPQTAKPKSSYVELCWHICSTQSCKENSWADGLAIAFSMVLLLRREVGGPRPKSIQFMSDLELFFGDANTSAVRINVIQRQDSEECKNRCASYAIPQCPCGVCRATPACISVGARLLTIT